MNSPTSFNAIPGQDDLAAVERDLSFHPSSTSITPKVLTRDQIERFNREGYLMPFRIFSDTEIAELRAYFDQLLAKYLAEGKDSYSISSAHLRHGRVWDVLANPRVVSIVSDLLGPSVVAWGSHFFCKMPGDGKTVSWHQDASYWPLTPSKAVTMWLAIDDADRGNACMRFIPGTHVLGHLTYKLSETDPSNVLNQTVPEVEKYGEPGVRGIEGRRSVATLRPATARVGGEHVEPSPLRADSAVHRGRRAGLHGLGRQGRDRRGRETRALGQPCKTRGRVTWTHQLYQVSRTCSALWTRRGHPSESQISTDIVVGRCESVLGRSMK